MEAHTAMINFLQKKSNWLIPLFGFLAIIVWIAVWPSSPSSESSGNLNRTVNATIVSNTSVDTTEAKVKAVVDGDTVDLENGTRVRVVGIDTPETVDPRKSVQCFGVEASNKMKQLVTGKTIVLTKSAVGDSIDKYGRQLYYLSLDNVDIGAKLIEDGYACAYTSYPHDRNDAYVALQQQAKIAKRGLWADSTCSGNANTNSTTVTTNTNTSTLNNTNTTITNTRPTPMPTASCNCTNDLDCSDFASHAAAQEVYNCCMEKVGYDFHKLDGNDNDGLACESLP